MMDKNIHDYDDIINLPHPVSTKHPQMSLADRAAQFSPFAALTGHEAAIAETARLTDTRPVLDESRKMELNDKLQVILGHISLNPEIAVTYFIPDEKKAGGSYHQVLGIIKKYDEAGHTLIMENGSIIPIDDILELESSLFEYLEND